MLKILKQTNRANSKSRMGLVFLTLLSVTLISGSLFAEVAGAAQAFADPAFSRLWNRTDKLVADGTVSRTFLWGPEPNTPGIQEDYADAPGGKRLVQYFDKSRMEITNPNGDKSNPYFVTNGLIARELMSGNLQLGDAKFEQRSPAEIGVAGDSDDTSGPTYKSLNSLTGSVGNKEGQAVTTSLNRAGATGDGSADFARYNVTLKTFVSDTGHNIAGPFWDFLNQTGPTLNPDGQTVQGRIFEPVFFATGLPITEPYWAKVKVANEVKDVLVQAFERRVLTYTPANSPAFQVEMGNVGQHYFRWRYGNTSPTPAPITTTPQPGPNPGGGVAVSGCLPAYNSAIDFLQTCVDNPTPKLNSDVTVFTRLIVNGQAVTNYTIEATFYSRGSNDRNNTGGDKCNGSSGANGVASCTRNIGNASPGYQVVIGVVVNYNGTTFYGSTGVTPVQ